MIKEYKVIDRDDVTHTLPVEEGISVMESIRDHLKVYGWGNCGGAMVCSTCHVYVKKGNFLVKDVLIELKNTVADHNLLFNLFSLYQYLRQSGFKLAH